MDHEAAAQLHASERYLLGELSPVERDEFEDHYFTCQDCAADVRLGVEFQANARAVFRERSSKSFSRQASEPQGWLAWLRTRPAFAISAALNIALLVAVGFGVARLNQPEQGGGQGQFYSSFFVPGAFRGEEKIKEVPAGVRLIGFYFDLSPQELGFADYRFRLEAAGGAVVRSGRLRPPAASSSEWNVAVPVAGLKHGVYAFIFSGEDKGRESEIRRTQIRIQP